MALSKNNKLITKFLKILAYIIILGFAMLATNSIILWLRHVNANQTLRILVPIIVFAASALGLWVTYRYLSLFIFQRFQLRGKLTFYFLLVSIGSIIVVGGLMFYLILLIENSFIKGERSIANTVVENYRELVENNKKMYETHVKNLVITTSQNIPVIFIFSSNSILFEKVSDKVVSKTILQFQKKIKAYFAKSKKKTFYIGEKKNIIIIKHKNYFYAEKMPEYLVYSFDVLNKNIEEVYRLNVLRKFIKPISVGSLIVFSVPLMIAVFFISFFIAQSLSKNIEKIAKGTEIIASGDLDYRVEINSRDEIQELANNFNKMAAELKKASSQIKRMETLEAWQEVAKRLAHEIKNPLTPIKLSSERLLYAYQKGRKDFPKILEKTVGTVISETGRLENLVNEFSKFARLPVLKPARMDIIQTLHQVINFFQGAYPDVSLESDVADGSFYLYYDGDQLKQVIINIITNSIEACSSKDKHVKLSALRNDTMFIIIINDKCGGIPLEMQEKIFEPYFTTKEQGTGLGLAIAERIIHEHNGTINFETDDVGTTFYIALPLLKGDDTNEK